MTKPMTDEFMDSRQLLELHIGNRIKELEDEIRRLRKKNKGLEKKLNRAISLIEEVCGEGLVTFGADERMRKFLGWEEDKDSDT